jgi:prepilin-type N-terminal cleavage/methylation domain-containing protein
MEGAMNKYPDKTRGFSLVEMLMTLAVLGVICAMAVGITTSMVHSAKADSALISIVSAVELARDRAIGERRDFVVAFTTPNIIQISRIEQPSLTQTVVLKTFLDNGATYVKFTGLPDTPDAFGNSSAITFGISPTIEFTSDGSLLDSSGDPINGTVFFGDPARSSSARALTIFGATGLIHGWKWDGIRWLAQQ